MLVFSHLHVDDTVIGSHALDRRTIGGVFALGQDLDACHHSSSDDSLVQLTEQLC